MRSIRDFIKKWALPVGFALVLLFSVSAIGFTVVNSYNTNQVAQSVQVTVQQHNQDLQTIKNTTQEIKTLQQDHENDLQTIKTEGNAIQQYAQSLLNTSDSNHATTLQQLQNICAAIPGCVEVPTPPSSTTTTTTTPAHTTTSTLPVTK